MAANQSLHPSLVLTFCRHKHNNYMRHDCRLLVAETSSSAVESAPTSNQSRRGGLLSRLCPSYSKFSICFKKLNCCRCLASKSIAGSKVGILAGSKSAMIGGSKVSVEEGSRSGLHPAAAAASGKCGWLRKVLCCSRRGGNCCSRCRRKADSEADGSRRRSNATSRMSKKQSRSSSTAVEVSVCYISCLIRHQRLLVLLALTCCSYISAMCVGCFEGTPTYLWCDQHY